MKDTILNIVFIVALFLTGALTGYHYCKYQETKKLIQMEQQSYYIKSLMKALEDKDTLKTINDGL